MSIKTIKESALSDLSELKQCANFLFTSWPLLSKYKGQVISYDNLDVKTRKIVTEATQHAKDLPLEVMRGSLALRVCACFEAFIQSAVIWHLSRYEGEGIEVPEKVKLACLHYSGIYFQAVYHTSHDDYSIYQKMASNLGALFGDDDNNPINKEVTASAIKRCSSGHLEKIFNKIGISDLWNKLAKEKKIRVVLSTKAHVETKKLLIQKIDEYWKMRNKLAHGEAGKVSLTSNNLEEILAFYEALTVDFCSMLETIKV